MKKGLLNITGERIRGVLRQALSPTFLIILLGAALLWYTSKLSYEYSTEMPLGIRIDGQKYRITAVVSGRGSAILAQQLSLKSRLSFTLDELSSRPSRETAGALTIAPASLLKAINGKITDLLISQVVDAPDFIPEAAERSDTETGTDESAATDYADPAGETPKERRQRERRERRETKEAARAAEAEAESSASGKETEEAPKTSKKE